MITDQLIDEVVEYLKDYGPLNEHDDRQTDALIMKYDLNAMHAKRLIVASRQRVSTRRRLQDAAVRR